MTHSPNQEKCCDTCRSADGTWCFREYKHPCHTQNHSTMEGWKDALYFEVMEDYLMHAKLAHLAKDPTAHMEMMRGHFGKLTLFIESLLAQKRESAERCSHCDNPFDHHHWRIGQRGKLYHLLCVAKAGAPIPLDYVITQLKKKT